MQTTKVNDISVPKHLSKYVIKTGIPNPNKNT